MQATDSCGRDPEQKLRPRGIDHDESLTRAEREACDHPETGGPGRSDATLYAPQHPRENHDGGNDQRQRQRHLTERGRICATGKRSR